MSIRQSYQAGDIVFQQGDPADCAYIIETGQVKITVEKNNQIFPITIMGEGEIIGEMALIDGLPRSATVTAISSLTLCPISRDQLSQRILAADPIVRLLVSLLVQRTRENNHQAGTKTPDSTNTLKFKSEFGSEALARMRFESDLQNAFDKMEFELHYQPIVQLKSQTCTGFEALIRWNSPTLGQVRPDRFMNIIEDSSLMLPVGRWIKEKALEDLAQLNDKFKNSFSMSINISARQFADPNFIATLEQITNRFQLQRSLIKLEVTERILLQGPLTLTTVEKCRELGYKISLDDFGTGYSGLSYLQSLTIDNLKIDQSFIKNLGRNSASTAIVQSIITLANSLGVELTAEGIENPLAIRSLIDQGCHLGQGYHFARPMPLSQLQIYLQKQKDGRVHLVS